MDEKNWSEMITLMQKTIKCANRGYLQLLEENNNMKSKTVYVLTYDVEYCGDHTYEYYKVTSGDTIVTRIFPTIKSAKESVREFLYGVYMPFGGVEIVKEDWQDDGVHMYMKSLMFDRAKEKTDLSQLQIRIVESSIE